MSDDRSVAIECLTEGIGLLPHAIRDAEGPSQAWLFRIQKRTDSPSSSYVVVHASFPEVSKERCLEIAPSIASCFEPAMICFVLSSQVGNASVFVPALRRDSPQLALGRVASVVATHMWTGSWDETACIEVLVNGHPFAVRTSFEGIWQAQWSCGKRDK